ncbi:arylsulfatase A-like enzyme [Sphingobium sp. B2D3A]|uniref:sulfatase family protein n=1 Tax=unclassified Sphingobium TaxID=2611147 RepID=UPI0022251AC8|nr:MULTISPECIES: sulfatase-like hydrolase/transferase [unclassified Sphingobium]MCW2337190.1 arylsulfatase A-like enzyme [Sphingobium sp. B2D3A]MCW2383648.1 arylsulfatase A-like enzyme [Sphingobium sp. B2D3D]
MTDLDVTRRSVLGQSLGVIGASMVGAGSTARAARPKKASGNRRKQPNILFIMTDDMGYADLSCYGRRDYETPAIDSLAADGMRFLQGYANSAVCSATRTGLITGRYQNRLPIGLEEPLAQRPVGLPPEHPTLPSLLRAVGYGTTLIGKWHLGALPKYGPLKSGYDHFWGFRGGGVDYFTHKFAGRHDLWDDDREVFEKGYLTDLLAERALETISTAAQGDKPFFISLHVNAPHWPWEGPGDEAEAMRLDADGKPTALMHYDGGSQRIYAQMVTRLDMQVGRILQRLDDLGIADDTIVIFTSDNGGERFADTWPFTGRKTELLEGGLRIPAIVRWPAYVPAGVTSDQVMMSMDWLPTLLAAAGGAPDPAYPSDGINLLPYLADPSSKSERTLCWRYKNLDQQACRMGDWKYLKILQNSFLFNVADDPMERANLKDRMPEKMAQVKAAYDAWDSQMLPLDPDSSTHGFTGKDLADHFGAKMENSVKPR